MSQESIRISTDRTQIDTQFVHQYLSEKAYWSKGRSKEDVLKAIEHSLCFSVFNAANEQIGFARVATDFVVFAWIMDLFIDEPYKGKGIGKTLVQTILDYPDLKEVNGFGLRTNDAHGLYGQFGFTEIPSPNTWMFKKNSV